MLIWRGWGILVLLVAVLTFIASKGVAEMMMCTPLSPSRVHIVTGLSLLIAAAAVYCLHLVLVKNSSSSRRHDLFFIPIRFWSILLLALGVVSFFK